MSFRPSRPLQASHGRRRDLPSEADVEEELYVKPLYRALAKRSIANARAKTARALVKRCKEFDRNRSHVETRVVQIMQELEEAAEEFKKLRTLIEHQARLQKDMQKGLRSVKSQAVRQFDTEENLRQQSALQEEILVATEKCAKTADLRMSLYRLMRQRQRLAEMGKELEEAGNKHMLRLKPLSIEHSTSRPPMQSIPEISVVTQALQYGTDSVSSLNQESWLERRHGVTMSSAFQSKAAIVGPGYFRAMTETLASLEEQKPVDAASAERLDDVRNLYKALSDVLRSSDFADMKGGRATEAKRLQLAEEEAAERAGASADGATPDEASADPAKKSRKSKFIPRSKRKNLARKDARITEAIEAAKILRAYRKVDVPAYIWDSIELDLSGPRQTLFENEDADDDSGEGEGEEEEGYAEEWTKRPEVEGEEDLDKHNPITPPAATTTENPLARLDFAALAKLSMQDYGNSEEDSSGKNSLAQHDLAGEGRAPGRRNTFDAGEGRLKR